MRWLFLYNIYFKLYCLYAHHTWSKLVSIGVFFFFFLVTYYFNFKSHSSCIFYFMHSSSCFLIHKACGGLCFLDQCEKQAASVQTQVSGGKENASPNSAGENSAEKSKLVPLMPVHSFYFVLFLVFGCTTSSRPPTAIYFNLTAEWSPLIQEHMLLVLNPYQFSIQ